MKIFKSFVLGAAIFFIAVFYFAPASIIQNFLPDNITTAGLNGTLWNGNAQTIVVDQINIQNTKWHASPLSLLNGEVQADVLIDSHTLKGQFDTTYAANNVRAKDIDLKGDLALFNPYFEKYGLTINGSFKAELQKLNIKNGIPKSVVGTLNTFNTNILGLLPLNLGDVVSTFDEQAGGLIINLNNTNGELDLNGAITVNNNGLYLANLTLSRNSSTTDDVLKTIKLLGKKVNEDSVQLNYSGKLNI